MRLFGPLSITKKMLLAPTVGLAIFSSYLWYSYHAHAQSQEALTKIQTIHFPLLQKAQRGLPLFDQLHNTLYNAVQAGEIAWLEQSAQSYSDLIEILDDVKTHYAPYVFMEQIVRIENHLIAYYQAASELSNIMIVKEDDPLEDLTPLIDTMNTQKEATRAYLSDFQAFEADIVTLTLDQSRQEMRAILIVGVILGMLAIALITVLALGVALPTRRTLKELLHSLHTLQEDKADFTKALKTSSKDELGAMVHAFNTLMRKLQTDYMTLRASKEDLERTHKTLQQTQIHLQAAKRHAEDATIAKSAFLATISHEIRTPLNALLGYVTLLKHVTLPQKEARYVQIMDRSGNHLLEIVNGVLDYSKIEAHKLELDCTHFDLKQLLSTVTALLEVQTQEKGLTLTLEVPPTLIQTRYGDALRVRQILTNLLGNAIKFTHKGAVGIRVETTPQEVTFDVWDTGIGLSGDEISRLFEPFTQADNTTTRAYGGTGLGLSIAKELIKLMQGSITIESTPDIGSHFIVTLPLAQSHEAPQEILQPVAVPQPAQPLHTSIVRSPIELRTLFENLLEALPTHAPKHIKPHIETLKTTQLTQEQLQTLSILERYIKKYQFKEAHSYLKEHLCHILPLS